MALAVATLAAALRAGARARTAADLAALAASDALAEGRDACSDAVAVATRNAAAVVSCRVGSGGVTVVVRARALSFAVHATARAVPGELRAALAAGGRVARGPPG